MSTVQLNFFFFLLIPSTIIWPFWWKLIFNWIKYKIVHEILNYLCRKRDREGEKWQACHFIVNNRVFVWLKERWGLKWSLHLNLQGKTFAVTKNRCKFAHLLHPMLEFSIKAKLRLCDLHRIQSLSSKAGFFKSGTYWGFIKSFTLDHFFLRLACFVSIFEPQEMI